MKGFLKLSYRSGSLLEKSRLQVVLVCAISLAGDHNTPSWQPQQLLSSLKHLRTKRGYFSPTKGSVNYHLNVLGSIPWEALYTAQLFARLEATWSDFGN